MRLAHYFFNVQLDKQRLEYLQELKLKASKMPWKRIGEDMMWQVMFCWVRNYKRTERVRRTKEKREFVYIRARITEQFYDSIKAAYQKRFNEPLERLTPWMVREGMEFLIEEYERMILKQPTIIIEASNYERAAE